MFRSFSFVRLAGVCALAGAAVLLVFGLMRLAVWSTGEEMLSEALLGPPQIFEWTVEDADFGGISALLMAPDGRSLIAGGDRGILVEATLTRDAEGQITAIGPTTLTLVRMRRDRPLTKFRSDFEALARAPDGAMMTAFEGYTRIERLTAPGALPTATHYWDRFTELFGNQGYEALATLPDGRLIAIRETPDDPGPAPSILYDGKDWTDGPLVPVSEGFAITGADVGPDGCLYLVERRFTLATGFRFRLTRLSGGPDAWTSEMLYTAAPADLGNAEAISVWAEGETLVLSVLSDDNFLPFTPTRLMEFRVEPGVGCRLEF